jgi:hypothetical protein
MNQSLQAVIGRHCRSVLIVTKGNKREACRILGISYHTLRRYLAGVDAEPVVEVPLFKSRETTSQQLLRLQVAISNVTPDTLLRELLLAEQRGAAEQARQTIAYLRPIAGVDAFR